MGIAYENVHIELYRFAEASQCIPQLVLVNVNRKHNKLTYGSPKTAYILVKAESKQGAG